MHCVPRVLKGLQNAAVRPRLSIKSRVTSAPWEAVRRHSVDDFVESTLVVQEGLESPKQRDGKPKRVITGPFLPRTAQVVAAPTTPASQINTSTKPNDEISLSNTVHSKSAPSKRPRPQKARPLKDPNNLVRRSPVRSRPDENKASTAPSPHHHPRVVHFEALPAGTSPQHVLRALNKALVAGDLAAKTAVVTAAELLLPSGAVRVRFLYPDGAREACLLARAGRLVVRGVPASARPEEEEEGRTRPLGDNTVAAAAAVTEAKADAGAKSAPAPPWTLDPRMRGADVGVLTESQRAGLGLRSKSPLMVFRGREERAAAGLGVSSVEAGSMRPRQVVPAVSGVKGEAAAQGPDRTRNDVLPAGAEEGEKHVPRVASASGAEMPAAASGQSV